MHISIEKKFGRIIKSRVLVLLVCLSAASNFSFGQLAKSSDPQSDASVPVIVIAGDVSCANLNDTHFDPRFEFITQDYELKITGLPNGIYTYTNGPGQVLVGPADATKSVTISASDGPAIINSFGSTRLILAVIIKAGTNSYIYPYNPGVFGDTVLTTAAGANFTHVSFCFEDLTLIPSAADATISGRVVNSFGRGIAGARITVNNATTGVVVTTITSPFGYYKVTNLESADFYILSVSHKRYNFADNTRSFTLNEDLTGADFVANP